MKSIRIKSTKGQRDALRKCHRGVGVAIYHMGNGKTCEFEFYLDRNLQPRRISDGQPISFEVENDDN